MRNIKIDHVACGVIKGRCSYPKCGIGLDSLMQAAKVETKIGLDPFGPYTNFADCVAKNTGKQSDPKAFCAWLHHKITGAWPSQDAIDKAEKPKEGEPDDIPPETPPSTPPPATTPPPPEPTPLQKAIKERMEKTGETEEQAKKWLEDETAGLHKPADKIIEEIDKKLALKKELSSS